MSGIRELIHAEPTIFSAGVVGVANTFLAVLVEFGVTLSGSQVGALMAFINAVMVLALAIWTRGQVRPNGQSDQPYDGSQYEAARSE